MLQSGCLEEERKRGMDIEPGSTTADQAHRSLDQTGDYLGIRCLIWCVLGPVSVVGLTMANLSLGDMNNGL